MFFITLLSHIKSDRESLIKFDYGVIKMLSCKYPFAV